MSDQYPPPGGSNPGSPFEPPAQPPTAPPPAAPAPPPAAPAPPPAAPAAPQYQQTQPGYSYNDPPAAPAQPGYAAPPPQPGYAAPPNPGYAPTPPPYGQQPVGAPGGPDRPYGGFWARAAANIIDSLIISVPGGILFFVMARAVPQKDPELCTIDGELRLCEFPTTAGWTMIAIAMLAWFIASLWFIAHMDGVKGATPGKKALGLEVVDQYSGGRIGRGRAIGRYFGRIISGAVLLLGFLWMLWDDKKQTWHDKMTSSVVVKKNPMLH